MELNQLSEDDEGEDEGVSIEKGRGWWLGGLMDGTFRGDELCAMVID